MANPHTYLRIRSSLNRVDELTILGVVFCWIIAAFALTADNTTALPVLFVTCVGLLLTINARLRSTKSRARVVLVIGLILITLLVVPLAILIFF
jgi:hypothetical protein